MDKTGENSFVSRTLGRDDIRVGDTILAMIPGYTSTPTEHIVIEKTPFTLRAVSTAGGYGSHRVHTLVMVPTDKEVAGTVYYAERSRETVARLIANLERFAQERPRNWIESVYTEAAGVLRILRLLYAKCWPAGGSDSPQVAAESRWTVYLSSGETVDVAGTPQFNSGSGMVEFMLTNGTSGGAVCLSSCLCYIRAKDEQG